MRCLYCGGPLPGKDPHKRGLPPSKFCSYNHGQRYTHLLKLRRRKGLPIEHCQYCGHVITRGKCKGCGGKPLNGGLAYLVLTIFRQAEEDGALGEMVSNGVAAELIGADPEYLKRLYMKGETL